MSTSTRTIRAPRGTELTCKSWQAEGAMRMLMNNLDPEVAERPDDLVVYGGRGRAARSWEAYEAIIRSLQELEPDETLLVQSGKPVGVVRTTVDAPRVMIANSNLVPHWATQERFDELEAKGLMIFGQMTAGSWIYIGTRASCRAPTRRTRSAHSSTSAELSRGRSTSLRAAAAWAAQPLAITMNEGTCLMAEVCRERLEKRVHDRYLDEIIEDLDDAIDRALRAKKDSEAVSIGWLGNAVDLLERLVERNIVPDTLTDQTSAHDPLQGYYPWGLSRSSPIPS